MSKPMRAETLKNWIRGMGERGVSWDEASFDLSEEIVAVVDGGEASVEDFQAAHAEGLRAHREKAWVSLWTTAAVDYDFFGTFTIEGPFAWDKRELRRVLAHPDYASAQAARYGSGLRGCWDEDPRVEEAKIREGVVRARVERVLLGFRVAAGAAWLASLPDAELERYDEDARDELLRGFGLRWTDHRAEQDRRAEEKKARERAEKWARCRALVPDGATLIDEGTPGFKGRYGWVGGRDADAWRAVEVRPHYGVRDDAEQAEVVGECGRIAGSLARVAELIEKSEMRIAGPEDVVPPRAVIERIGRPYKEILRFEVEGRVLWVGRSLFSTTDLVLDDAGHIVRSKKLREAASRAYFQRTYGGAK